MSRSHRALPLALLSLIVGVVAACDNPTAPAPLKLDTNVASDLSDTLGCSRGYIIIQGVVQCRIDGP